MTTPIYWRWLSHTSISGGYFKGACPIGGVVCDVCRWGTKFNPRSSVGLCGPALGRTVEWDCGDWDVGSTEMLSEWRRLRCGPQSPSPMGPSACYFHCLLGILLPDSWKTAVMDLGSAKKDQMAVVRHSGLPSPQDCHSAWLNSAIFKINPELAFLCFPCSAIFVIFYHKAHTFWATWISHIVASVPSSSTYCILTDENLPQLTCFINHKMLSEGTESRFGSPSSWDPK